MFRSSSRPEPQTPPSKLPYSDGRSYQPGKEEDEYRRQLVEQTRQGYYVQNAQKYQDTEL